MKSISKNIKKSVQELFEAAVVGAFVLILVYIFAGQFLQVSGDSMNPTLLDKEQLLAEKLSIKYQNLKRAQIIVFYSIDQPNKLVVKRVIGLPGETFSIKGGIVYINNAPLDEPYIDKSQVTDGKTEIVENKDYLIPSDSYIVLGDNRKNSVDSRDWGTLKKERVVGKVLVVYSPIKRFRFIR